MSNKKQSAMNWAEETIKNILANNNLIIEDTVWNTAKQMEREQIKEAWLDAWKESMLNPLPDKYYKPEAEQYYNETYGGQE